MRLEGFLSGKEEGRGNRGKGSSVSPPSIHSMRARGGEESDDSHDTEKLMHQFAIDVQDHFASEPPSVDHLADKI